MWKYCGFGFSEFLLRFGLGSDTLVQKSQLFDLNIDFFLCLVGHQEFYGDLA